MKMDGLLCLIGALVLLIGFVIFWHYVSIGDGNDVSSIGLLICLIGIVIIVVGYVRVI